MLYSTFVGTASSPPLHGRQINRHATFDKFQQRMIHTTQPPAMVDLRARGGGGGLHGRSRDQGYSGHRAGRRSLRALRVCLPTSRTLDPKFCHTLEAVNNLISTRHDTVIAPYGSARDSYRWQFTGASVLVVINRTWVDIASQ